MALTTYQQPAAYTPNYNPQRFKVLSNQTASSDFMYRVICTDIITGESQTYNIKHRPDNNQLWFDAKIFTDQFIKNYIPNNVYGFQPCTDAVRKIRVNIGEYYGATYYAGSNYDYIIWNGVARPLDWVYFDYTDYVYELATNQVSLEQMATGFTFSDKSEYLYFLGGATSPQGIIVDTYDSGGTLIGTSTIANPYYSSTDYTKRYLAIDIGLKGLTNIPSALVTGAYPIITASVASYNVSDSYPFLQTFYKEMTVLCEPRFTVYTIHYLANNGRFETLHFNKMSEFTEISEKTFYRQNPNAAYGTSWGYGLDAQWEKALSSTGQEQLLLNTDWLSEDQFIYHRQLFTSPVVYLDYGSTTGLVPVKVTTNSILVNKGFNKKNDGITIVVEPTYKNTYQHG